MFKFNFSDLDPEDNENQLVETGDSSAKHCEETVQSQTETQVRELLLDELAQTLPPAFSYSPLVIPLSNTGATTQSARQGLSGSNSTVTLLRRDLFDARYQLISESDAGDPPVAPLAPAGRSEDGNPENALKFIDNPSDLVPGVYEGGLKTWECSLDLVDYLASTTPDDENIQWFRGKKVIEIGCGTAIPSLFLLYAIFSQPQWTSSAIPSATNDVPQTQFILQDYNSLVLRLVTFPNVLLTWYSSPLAETYRSQHPSVGEDDEGIEFDASKPGDLQITTELLAAFQNSLDEQRISIRFISGSWQSLANTSINICKFPFDITLTSETIYQTSNLSSLITLLNRCALGAGDNGREGSIPDAETVSRANGLSLRGNGRGRMCLVAAKVLYFGVGGGVLEFEKAVREVGGTTLSVLERKEGVGRKVLSVIWA